MERRAILIGLDQVQNEMDSPALAVWSQFLQSAIGGEWSAGDIVKFCSGNRDSLLDIVKGAADVDYTLIVYVGRGISVRSGVPWAELQLELSSNETVLERDLNTGSPRCAMILDVSDDVAEHSIQEKAELISKKCDTKLPLKYSEIYKNAINNAERGLAKIWVTSKPEKVDKRSSFSSDIISQAVIWSGENQGVLSFSQAVKCLVASGKGVKEREVEYRGGRRLHDFPLAVGVLP